MYIGPKLMKVHHFIMSKSVCQKVVLVMGRRMTKGGGGVSQKMTKDDEGGRGGQPKDDEG